MELLIVYGFVGAISLIAGIWALIYLHRTRNAEPDK